MKLFTKKINGIILRGMTRPVVYLNPRYSEVRNYRVFYIFRILCMS
jgi:hypothetical protein